MERIKVSTVTDNQAHTSELSIESDKTSYSFGNLSVSIGFHSPKVNVMLTNNSSTSLTICRLEILAASLNFQGYSKYMINPEFPNENIIVDDSRGIKSEVLSFLYTFLQGVEDNQSLLVGFLSSHSSRNYIRMIKKGNLLNIYAVYDFTNHVLPSKAVFNLDSLYIEFNRNYSTLLNNYAHAIMCAFPSAVNKFSASKTWGSCLNPEREELLYADIITDKVLHAGDKPVSINIKGKKFFLLDVSMPEVKEYILNTCTEIIKKGPGVIYIKNIMHYINEIIKLKCFNPYFEISSLLQFIRNSISNISFMFDDCPEGIALNTLDILTKEINIRQKQSILGKYLTKRENQSIDYNFIINTIIQRNVFANSTRFSTDNKKIQQTMEVISLSMNLLTNNHSELNSMAQDIDPYRHIVTYLDDKDVFAVLRFGKNSIYMAVFNLSNSPRRFYWDFSTLTKQNIPDGVAVDIYTDSSYLISNGKIHIRKIPPMDCCLIVKPINNILLSEVK